MSNLRCAWYYDRPFAADDDKALWDFSLFSRSMIVLTLMILLHVFAVYVYMSLLSGADINLEHNPANLTPMLYQTLILARASEHIFGRPR